MLIDTHCHLNFPDFKSDLDKVIKDSIVSGVTQIICASSNISDSKKAIDIAGKYKNIIYASCGIHPQKTDPDNSDSLEKQIEQLSQLLIEHNVKAIGECGLDYSPAPPNEKDRTKEKQLFLFQKQIEIAQIHNLPIIIHCRKAFSDVVNILAGYKNIKGVFHCYSAGFTGIKKVSDLGFYFGINGNITYDIGLQNVVTKIPLEKIILETDAPFLAPDPYRGQRNEPKNVKIVAEKLAVLKGISFQEVEKKTNDNIRNLFEV